MAAVLLASMSFQSFPSFVRIYKAIFELFTKGGCLSDILSTSNHPHVMNIIHISSLTTYFENVATRNEPRPPSLHNFCKDFHSDTQCSTVWSPLLYYRSHHPRRANSICASSRRTPCNYGYCNTRRRATLGQTWRKFWVKRDPKVPWYTHQNFEYQAVGRWNENTPIALQWGVYRYRRKEPNVHVYAAEIMWCLL